MCHHTRYGHQNSQKSPLTAALDLKNLMQCIRLKVIFKPLNPLIEKNFLFKNLFKVFDL